MDVYTQEISVQNSQFHGIFFFLENKEIKAVNSTAPFKNKTPQKKDRGRKGPWNPLELLFS